MRTETPGSARGAGGLTLIELLVCIGLFCVVGAVCFSMFSQANRQTDHIYGALDAEQTLRLALVRISRELQESHVLFHPSRFGETADGVGFVTAAGEAVFYYAGPRRGAAPDVRTEPLPASGARDEPVALWRANVNTRQTACILENVNAFRVTLMPSLPGKVATCVTLHLSVLEKEARNAPRQAHAQLTRVFLRNFEAVHPDETIPGEPRGTP